MDPRRSYVVHRGNSIISIETLPDYPDPVVIKKSSMPRLIGLPDPLLEREFEMTQLLDTVEGVRKALGHSSIDNQPALILEYIDGETLRDHLDRHVVDLRSKLEIAVDLARILGRIHREGVLHLGIDSRNVLINNEPRAIHIIDFSASTRIGAGDHRSMVDHQSRESLTYISPEQTGRINRAVDERSDLYSLGVVLYELMTRRLPFDAEDPLELVHHHIAANPVSPSEVSSEIPEVVSYIILKLLSKNAEDRYQSAAGLQIDLRKCLDGLASDDTIEAFPLAARDHFIRLVIPQQLYGRESESKELVDAFNRACRETSAMVFISGYSGIGKTALVEELQGTVVERRGHFAKGKFDQFLRATPYSAISRASDDLVAQILTEPEEQLHEWKARIQSAVGGLGKVLTDVIPALDELIGLQPDVPQLKGQEAENRFNYVFINLLKAVATEDRPLVAFVDDLQWIDAASLRLLRIIRSEFDRPGLLVIGAYRDNEVDDSHPLKEFIDEMENEGIDFQILKLENLPRQHIDRLLTDSLGTSEGVEDLGSVLFEKTRGNPLFFRRLLSSLDDEGRIRYEPEEDRWAWDAADIESKPIADNVADLLAKTIVELPQDAQEVLNLAACIGNRFEIPTLSVVSGRSRNDVIGALSDSTGGQYVVGSGDVFEFVHDQVQKAAYSLLDARDRPQKHLEIARLLLADTDEGQLGDRIFDIVAHYNSGLGLLTDRAEKHKAAELNLKAARKSKMSSAYAASTDFLRQSLHLLDEDAWRDDYELTLEIHNELIDACYLSIQHEEVKSLFETIIEKSHQADDSFVAYQTMVMTRVAENESKEAISMGEGYLEKLGISFDADRTSDLSPEELYRLPVMEDKEQRAAMEILMALATPVIFSAPERLYSLFCTMLNIISRHGNSEISSFAVAWYATMLCLQDRYEEGNVYGQLAVDLLEEYPSPGMSSKIMNMRNAWIRHWQSSVHDLIAPLKEYHQIGLQDGEFEWCLYCLGNYTLLLWGSGKPLPVFAAEAGPCVRLCASKNQEVTFLICSIFAQAGSNLMQETAQTTALDGRWFSEQSMVPELEGNDLVLSYYRSVKMTLSYLFEEIHEAYQHVEEALKIRSALSPHYLYTKVSFYGGLICLASLADANDDADRQERLERSDQFEQEMKQWAELAPMNYQHQVDLLLAEKSRVENDRWQAVQFYEKAVNGARDNEFVHDEALTYELFGRFWLEQGNNSFARVCMVSARGCYQRWGATAKVEHLEERYPQFFSAKTLPSATERAQVASTESKTDLDLDTVLKASRALSGEIVLSRLLARMMSIVIENSGAQRGVLLLRHDDDWVIEAEGFIDGGEVAVEQSIALEDGDHLPASLIHYVARTRETVVLSNAAQDGGFAQDSYVAQRKLKSVMAAPLIHQGRLDAILYLENNLVTNVFSDERVGLLNLLSSQMAMALENAQLYGRLKEQVTEKTADLAESALLVEQLRESRERYELAVAGSAAGLWDWDLTSESVFYSKRFKELLGFAPEEFSSRLDEFWDRLHPDDTEAVQRALDRHFEDREDFTIDYRLQTKSGEYHWFYARGQALWDDDGEPTRMSGSITDITLRKLAEEERAKSEERFRALMEQSPLAIEILSPDGKIMQVNSAWRRLWDVTEEEAATVLAGYNMLTDPQTVDLGVAPLIEKAFAGEPVVLPPIQYSAQRTTEDFDLPDMEVRAPWIRCYLYPVKDSQGDVDFVVNTYQDITDIKLAEADSRRHQDALARVDRAISMGHLTGSIAHELNQPLTGILSNAQAAEMLLNKGQWDAEELAEIMADIVADTKRGGEVIRNLRELFREQKGEYQSVDINSLIAETVNLLNSEFIARNIVVTSETARSIRRVNGNRIQIQQVLVNLIMNGVQAMAEIPRDDRDLRIESSSDPSEVRVLVEDHGHGIDPERIDRIFEPLATWKPGGTGMGLAISNSIVVAHGGKMWAENKSEGGGRVGFSLPVLNEEELK